MKLQRHHIARETPVGIIVRWLIDMNLPAEIKSSLAFSCFHTNFISMRIHRQHGKVFC